MAATGAAVDGKSMSFRFFDLPPELRNRIYYFLFKGQEIAIRHVDTTTTWRRSDGAHIVKRWVSRERKVGANIIFASKSALAEARPMLLYLASFDLKPNHLFPTSANNPQVQQGFGCTEFQATHSITYPDRRYIYTFLAQMPCLHAVSVSKSTPITYSDKTLAEFKSHRGPGGDQVLDSLGKDWRRGCIDILGRLKDRASRQNLQPHLLVGTRTKFKGRTASGSGRMLSETIWVTATEDKAGILVPERHEPGLIAAWNNQWGFY
ncbi:hypothetical protein H2200_010225 [Cladophialophora chaetospira]|uniref:Uncharacterized protein n=1 Tax=Cladophialophora chaetospira TaxID=386627 RepID=A0AA38X2E3_9EURO|nr:hypothetical protein H2200_010225 [Cladophialophora chaetospira]